MRYSFDLSTAGEFAALYSETGWANWPLETFERALAGSWVVCTARDEDGALLGSRRGVEDVQIFAARGRAGFYERPGFVRRPAEGPGMDLDTAAE